LTRSLAQGKLDALASQYALPVRVVAVAADTLVCLEGNLLGKPSGAEDAARMLRLLSGKVHEVKTGIAMLAVSATDSFSQLAVETTRVKFADLDDRQIAWYLATGEPSDKAGAYAIQGYGAALVEWISGCYYNVMGLPVFRLMDMLRSAADHFDSDSSFRDLLPWA
jgi:septum formation protein